VKCVGSHLHDDWDEEPGPAPDPEAEYFRECSYCGATVWLCAEHLNRIFLCSRCFSAQRSLGKEGARRSGRRRERKREWARRARRRRLPVEPAPTVRVEQLQLNGMSA